MEFPDATAIRERFDSNGFVGPIPVLDSAAAVRLARRLHEAPAAEWRKGGAASSRACYLAGTHPTIVEGVSAILGHDVILWGAKLVVRRPGQVHPWHTDLETADGPGRTVSVWLGLDKVSLESSLQVIPYSHHLGVSVQEVKQHKKVNGARQDSCGVAADLALEWARELDPRCEVVQFTMGDGDAILFDGRLWHGSDNRRAKGTRTALLLQYTTPDRPVRIPDYAHLEWPFKFHDTPLPPCIIVQGSDSHGVNRVVPPPPSSSGSGSWTNQLALPLGRNLDSGWQAHAVHSGGTAFLPRLTCHASVLEPGTTPHAPHEHPEEEALVVLDGEATLLLGTPNASIREKIARGAFAYYPSGQPHTLTNASDRPVTYLMFKWRGGGASPVGPAMGTSIYRPEDPRPADGKEKRGGRTVEVLLDGPTDFLRKFHIHRSTLRPGGGYDPHVDAYDVALLVMEGTIETLGQRMEPGGVAFYAAGEFHGIRNVGETPAAYLVFEFHGSTKSGEEGRSTTGFLRQARTRIRRLIPRTTRESVRRHLASFGRRIRAV